MAFKLLFEGFKKAKTNKQANKETWLFERHPMVYTTGQDVFKYILLILMLWNHITEPNFSSPTNMWCMLQWNSSGQWMTFSRQSWSITPNDQNLRIHLEALHTNENIQGPQSNLQEAWRNLGFTLINPQRLRQMQNWSGLQILEPSSVSGSFSLLGVLQTCS